MKIKKGFILRPTMGYTLVIATGKLSKEFNGVIKLNETSADIWRWISEGMEREEMITRYKTEYNVSEETAVTDIDTIIKNMTQAGVFEED